MKIKAVVFDVFGTLVEIQERRSPYRQLMQWIAAQGRTPLPTDSAVLMSNPMGLAATASYFGTTPPLSLLEQWESDLEAELRSIRPFPETNEALLTLQHSGLQLGICSNLAMPYGSATLPLLPLSMDAYAWSFEVGAIKPDPEIYANVIAQLQCHPEQVLFVGDTLEADYLGPTRFGMRAIHLCRHNKPSLEPSISSLSEVMSIVRGYY